MLQFSSEAASKIGDVASECADVVTQTKGDTDVTESATLAGSNLSDKASTAGTAVSDARTKFSGRLTSHSEGTYNATRDITNADQQAADGARAN